jgi:hypothetical protein
VSENGNHRQFLTLTSLCTVIADSNPLSQTAAKWFDRAHVIQESERFMPMHAARWPMHSNSPKARPGHIGQIP